jgi:O-antigen/teichoic acid export membrane protein
MIASVRQRFIFTVGSNLVRSLFSFTTGMLLARWLGPNQFGRMAFLLGTFLALRPFFDMGSSTAFYTFMSQQQQSRGFVNGYFKWLAVQFLVPLCVVGIFFPIDWIQWIWHGEKRGLVVAAFVASFMQDSVWANIQQAAESQRQTVRVQSISVVVISGHLLAVVVMYLTNSLSLGAIFGLVAIEYLMSALVAERICISPFLRPASEAVASDDATSKESMFRRYFRYCLPMVPYCWIGFAYAFADRWLLQHYGGSVQQAYYSVGAQFSAVALLATTSILQIFWKEIAEAHHRGDAARTRHLYRRASHLLFFIGAMIAGYCLPFSGILLTRILGAQYSGGALTLAIMFLYPIHQSMGQIGSTMLYATERVSTQVIVGSVGMIVSIIVTYLVLATSDARIPGLGLGSTGLALKVVVFQIVQVNIVAYLIARRSGWPFQWLYQPVNLICCAGLGWLSASAAAYIGGSLWGMPLEDLPWPELGLAMAFAGLLYLGSMGIWIYTVPSVLGMSRGEFKHDADRILGFVFGRFRTN